MFREAMISLVLMGAALALAPASPALAGVACEAWGPIERDAQDDARSGGDAPDAAASAFRVLADGYYWGYLSPVGHEAADREDWYVFGVPAGTEVLMANVTEAFPLLEPYTLDVAVYAQSFLLALFAPGALEPVTTSTAGGTIVLENPAPGDYLVRLTATTLAEAAACGGGAGGTEQVPGTEQVRNHGLYVGCNPVCVSAA